MEIHDLTTETREEGRGKSKKIHWHLFWLFVLFSSLISRPSSLWAATPDGYVVKVESSTVYLDWGKASGVAAGDQFKVYRQGEPLKHPVTGEILGHSEQNLGQGVIDNVEDKFSTGKLIETKGAVKAGDRTRRLERDEGRETREEASSNSALVSRPSSLPSVPKELWRSEPIKHEAT